MAPERFPQELYFLPVINGPSRASDVYSITMASFEVRSSVVGRPTT